MLREGQFVLYDGECQLCNGAVAFIQRHDRKGRFRCMPLDSPEADRLLTAGNSAGNTAGDSAGNTAGNTLHLLDPTGHHERSTAVLRIAAGLGPPWSLFRVLRIVPRRLRDAVYDYVARHRKRQP